MGGQDIDDLVKVGVERMTNQISWLSTNPAFGRDFKAVHNFTLGADIVKYIKLRDWIYYKTHLCISKIKYGDITRYVFFVKWDDFRIC